ncbi:SixA phosphatase family protein [Sedimentitalea todarodis]|uniref:Histidine phosphatase family protein n=1 Tax=Sedimentitalea todarodis TaxID=1631240 RepID=A0ABU3VI95_9RHOB|nr:histidine phosphatase family protein [Sedimentitalea todarodis]MDU9005907.1 histidine phosphatase family protein [Sedimentitalea todarodis]
MTRTLILMRHTKSSWDDYTLADHDRRLNKRGQRSAKALGEWLSDKPWQTDQALVSTATRTRETFAGLGLSLDAEFTRTLYHADAAELQLVLETAVGATVLMIGHNPGISEFAQDMAATAPKHPRFSDFPTGATVVMEFDIQGWDDVETRTGRVLDFVVPRELLA